MLRSLVLIFSCMCVAVVLSEAAGIMLLWQQGLLTPHHLHEIQLVFTSDPSDAERETDVVNSKPLASLQEVTQARAIKVFELDRREAELTVLKNMASNKALELETQQAAFRAQRKAFEEELAALRAQQSSAAIEQARGVLLALPPRDAVEKLMASLARIDDFIAPRLVPRCKLHQRKVRQLPVDLHKFNPHALSVPQLRAGGRPVPFGSARSR